MNSKILVIVCLLCVAKMERSVGENTSKLYNGMQSYNSYNIPITSANNPNPRHLLNPNIDTLLTSDSMSGTQPTIVAIPLYIKNTLSSKYPSIFEILSSTSVTQNGSRIRKPLDRQNSFDKTDKPVEQYQQNDFKPNHSTLRLLQKLSQPQKAFKYNISQQIEEQLKYIKQQQRKELMIDSEANQSEDYTNPHKITTHSSVSLRSSQNANPNPNPNQYLQSNERITLLRSSVPHKQSSAEFGSDVTAFGLRNSNDMQNMKSNDEKPNENLDFGTGDSTATNSQHLNRETTTNSKSYTTAMTTNGRSLYKKPTDSESSYISKRDNENMDQTNHFRFSDSLNQNQNNNYYYSQNGNKYENAVYNTEYINNKSPDISSGPSVSNVKSLSQTSNPFSPPISTNAYSFRQNYDNNYQTVSPKPHSSIDSSFSATVDEPSYPTLTNTYNSNFRPNPFNNYKTDFQPIISNVNQINSQSMPLNTYSTNVSPLSTKYYYNNFDFKSNSNNNYNPSTESKSTFNSNPNNNPNDYTTNAEEDNCFDDNSNDFKSTPLSQKSKTGDYEVAKSNHDNFEFEDLDPSKLDFKIIHLPVSLLRRLIGQGDLGLPTIQ